MTVYKIYEYSIYLRAQGLFIARAREVNLVLSRFCQLHREQKQPTILHDFRVWFQGGKDAHLKLEALRSAH